MPTPATLDPQREQRLYALLSYYQLERDPFSDQGMSGLFFAGGDRKNTVEALLHFSRYGSAPMFLSAPSGFGKTTLLHEFAQRVEQDINVAVVGIEMLLTSAHLSEKIVQGFGLKSSADRNNLEILKEWLFEQRGRNRQAVLCVDDAQHLGNDFILQLLTLAGDTSLAFKLIFSGEPSSRVALEDAVEQHGMLFNTLELIEFNQSQVKDYVQYRMGAVGYRGECPLTSMQLQAAALRSRGSIAQLHDMVRDFLIAGIDGDPARQRKGFPVSNLVIASLVAAVTIYFGWRSLDVASPMASRPIALEKAPSVESGTTEQVAEGSDAAVASGQVRQAIVKAPLLSGMDAGSSSGANDNSVTAVSVSAVEAGGTAESVPANIAIARESSGASDRASVRGDGKAIMSPSNVIDAAMLDPDAQEAPFEALPGNDRSAFDGERSKRLEAVRQVNLRLQAWSNEGYALQIFGTHNEQRAKKLVEEYFGEADLLFYETRHNGKPWFVVINGPYSGRQTAQESIATLPESLRRLRPWPRNIASIKGDISRYDELLNTRR